MSGPAGNILERERFQGFKDGLEAAGLPSIPAWSFPGITRSRPALRQVRICWRDKTSERRLLHQRRNGHRAHAHPFVRRAESADDISVAGFDDIEFAAVAEPALTTIHQPRRELGQAAATTSSICLQGAVVQAD